MTKRHWVLGWLFSLISVCTYADPSPSLQIASASNGSPASDIPASSFLSNIHDLELVDQRGKAFNVQELRNKIVLFNFIFTDCGSICPMQTKVLTDVMDELPMDVRSQVRFISISIDPENDTPEKMLAFSQALHADINNWSFLTGKAEDINQLTTRLLIFNEGEENKPQVHRTSLWLVDKQGRMMQRYRGDPPDKDRLVRELTQISHLQKN